MSTPHTKLAVALGGAAIAASVQRLLKWRADNSASSLKGKYPRPVDGSADWLSVEEYAVLICLCDAFCPQLAEGELGAAVAQLRLPAAMLPAEPDEFLRKHAAFLTAGALNRDVQSKILNLLDIASSETEKAELKQLFWLLSSSVGCFALTGMPAPFFDLSLDNRVECLRRLQRAFLQDLKVAFQTLKRIVMSVFMDTLTEEEWTQFGYNPTETVSKPTRITDKLSALPSPVAPDSLGPAEEWTIDGGDVVVVGSGAGGGTLASELVKAGVRVLVLEKGGYYRSDDFKRWRQGEAQPKLFDKAGLCQSKNGSIGVLAGSCAGGGTTLNWMASFRTPAHVLADWAAAGLPQFAPDGCFHASLDAVHKLLSVNSKFSYREDGPNADPNDDPHFAINGNNRSLWEGAKACGFTPERIPRNVKACVDCGHCNFGCSYNSKQSTLTALMEPLGSTGRLQLLCHATVHTVTRDSAGQATGVEGTVLDPTTGISRPFRVIARIVVVAAGALHTPAVLLRSGFSNPKIGKHLTLHPVLGCGGISSAPSGLQSGVSMGVVVKGHPALELSCDPGFGVAVETPPVNLNLLGLLSQWNTGLLFKLASLQWSNLIVYINISRDHSKESNRIALDKDGNFEIHYELTPQDEANLKNGLLQTIRMIRHTPGCRLIQLAHETMDLFTDIDDDAAFDKFLNEVKSTPVRRGEYTMFSAHQMGSCRMAASPQDGPVSPDGSLFECGNVYVSDASLFPTSLGVNPMITVEAMAHMVSRSVMKQLNVKPFGSEW